MTGYSAEDIKAVASRLSHASLSIGSGSAFHSDIVLAEKILKDLAGAKEKANAKKQAYHLSRKGK